MARFLKHLILAALPVLLVVLAVFFTPLDRRFAYSFIEGDCSGHGKWIYDRIHENETPIDVAIIGTSVGWGLFDDAAMTSRLSEAKGKDVHVANLSYCRPGFNMRALVVQELLAAKKPNQMVVELQWNPSSGGHKMYGYVATTEMLLSPATFLYQEYPSDIMRALVVRWEQIRSRLYPRPSYVADPSDFGYTVKLDTIDQDKMKRFHQRVRAKELYPALTLQQRIHYYVYWKNMEYIAALCEDAGVELLFCYVNPFGRGVNEPRFQNRVEAIAPILYPPDSIFQNPMNYWDLVHLNRNGANAMTDFLLEELAQREY